MPKFNDYPHIFSQLKVGNTELKNRILFSPAVSAHATSMEGDVTEGLIEFIGAQARSGAAMVTIGATPVDYRQGRDFIGHVSVVKDPDIPGLKLLADEAHRYGAKISIELTHAGRLAHTAFLDGRPALVPSVVSGIEVDSFLSNKMKEISHKEMQEVIGHFVACVRRCMAADFDMVMIHGAHGNLLSSFLSEVFNKRTDTYGGSLENRMRFPLEVLKAVRDIAGNRMNIEYRISGNEYIEGSPTVEDIAAFLKEAQKYIDLVNISGGLILNPDTARYNIPTYHLPHMLNVPYAEAIKKSLDIPLSVAGNITTLDEAEELLRTGRVDAVTMCRNLIADQDYVTKAYRGKSNEIRPCLRCSNCTNGPIMGAPLRCAVNPQAGREVKYRYIRKGEQKKKIMIIGGGPSGMMAAGIAVQRGHDVVLYEKSGRLGGRLYEASAMSCKDGFRLYTDWNIKTILQSGAKIVLNTTVTPGLIEQENPDAVIIAIGAEDVMPQISGLDLPHVVSVGDADLKKVPIGQHVVICGGGMSGSECAIELAKQGKNAAIIDLLPIDELMNETNNLIKANIVGLIKDLNIRTYYEAKVNKITEKYVEITGKYQEIQKINADTVVIAFGLNPNRSLINELLEVIPETYVVGDSQKPGDIGSANMSAFNIAVEI